MRKFLSIIICFLTINCIQFSAEARGYYKYVYDLSGKRTNEVSLSISDLKWKGDNEYTLSTEDDEKRVEIDSLVSKNAKENEQVIIIDFKTDNEENPYPEIESMKVSVECIIPSGGWRILGKDYRLVYFSEENVEDLSSNITYSGKSGIKFKVNKLGKYIIYLNPKVYDLTFYFDEPIPTEEGNIMPEIYYEVKGMGSKEFVEFPEMPNKKGYVFTGWKAWSGSGIYYIHSQPIHVNEYREYYATWCPEDEYEPIELKISSNKAITKGKENGKKITLETNYGVFADEEELNALPEYWSVIGSNEITVESVERIDDKTIEITLSGKSEDIYKKSEIYIEFDSSLLLTEPYEDYGELYYPPHTKIKLDEVGVKAKMYRSDNSITLSKQHKHSSGSSGSSGNSMPAVIYNPSVQTTETADNQIILAIGKKEASVFGEIKTNDVAPIIRNDRTMLPTRFIAEAIGAEVEWDNITRTVTITKDNTEIIITIDSETAIVNGEPITLDSPAFIENDRTYTPLRFIVESLGSTAEWSADSQTVTIKKL